MFIQAKFRSDFADLGSEFSVQCKPIPIRDPQLVCHSSKTASMLGLGQFDEVEITKIFSGNQLPSFWQPIAHRYAGHQYGKFNHFLGDGRCLHLTELETQHGPFDISLKGSGKTPFARDADGRANLATGIKEFLLSSALDALGTPTSQSLFLIRGKNPIGRQGNLQPASVLTRVAPSLIRIGHFENFHYSSDGAAIKKLADFCLEHYFQACLNADNPYQAMLEEVVVSTAKLIANWQSIGFVHGTMNTDNHSILGLTLDHGTCAFMDIYDPDFVSTSDDVKALFAYDQQPSVGAWNCGIFAQTLSSQLSAAEIAQSLDQYGVIFEAHYTALMREKLGLQGEQEDDLLLVQDLLTIFKQHSLSYTPSMRSLSRFSPNSIAKKSNKKILSEASSISHAIDPSLYHALKDRNWIDRYFRRADPNAKRRQSRMNKVNPRFVLKEQDISDVVRDALIENYTPLNALLQSIENPF